MLRPMRSLLRRVSGRTSLHMPAAQGRAPFPGFPAYHWDTTELPVTDDLYHPGGAIAQAEAMIARSAGAAATLMLHGGSTAGIHAMLLYACGHGGQVVLPRNVHLSCLNLCAVAGIDPVFAEPSFTTEGRVYTTPQAYAQALDRHPRAAAALALSTDYYGLRSDLRGIADAVHARGKLLLCDEAHGAYFNWRSDLPNAGACGADLFVQSAHKTLPALTPGAWLHAMPGVDAQRLRALLRMVQTSSPSFLIMLSLDDARAWMDAHGQAASRRLLAAVEQFYRQAAPLGFSDGQPSAPEGMVYDRLRLVLRAARGGEWLQKQLEARGLDVEMCDDDHVVCILSLMDGPARLGHLLRALRSLARQSSPRVIGDAPSATVAQLPPALPFTVWPPRRTPLSQAAFAEQVILPPPQAVGQVSAAAVGLYPPGVAWLTPGEEITPEVIRQITAAPPARLFGLTENGCLRCVKR